VTAPPIATPAPVVESPKEAAPVAAVATPPVVEAHPPEAAATAPSTGSGQAPSTSSGQAPPQRPALKDGSYTGWGTSRHGDIQATVVVENGRIASATISQCLTRYSCSWIAALPPQVVSRQSPETDYVSGATQSTNAFYYAVVEALSKAK
jgi:uncharacterized protein with FMN-binding domain